MKRHYRRQLVLDGQAACHSCGDLLPLTSEFFAGCAKSPSGFQYACKRCHSRYQQTHREAENRAARARRATLVVRGDLPMIDEPEFAKYLVSHTQEQRPDGCWVWGRGCNANGYGSCSHKGLVDTTHRWAYRVFVGPIPQGLHVLHTCDNRRCINPSHLFLGTNADNVADRHAKGRSAKGERYPQAILSDGAVRRLRAMCRDGAGLKDVAVVFGIDPSTVCHVASGRRWAHVREG